MFKLEIKDEAEAEALISQNLTCHITGIIYKVEEFRSPVSVQQCWNCQSFGHSAKTCRCKTKCLSVGRATITKDALTERTSTQNATTVKGHTLLLTKGVQRTKKQAFRQQVVDNQKSYAAILRQNTAPPQPQDKTFTFSAEQLVKFVANVAIQVAQPQVCCISSPQDANDIKSSMCRRVSEATKTHLGVDIAGSSLSDAIGHLRPPVPSATKPKPFLPKVKPPSNSPYPPKSPNHLPSLRHSAPLTNLARLSPNSLKLHSRSIILGHLS